MTVRFRLLGAVEASVDGRPIPLGHTQLRCTLAVLLVEANHPVTVDQVVDRVWTVRRLPDNPRRAVQHNMALLRRTLAPATHVLLARRGAGYQLTADPDTIDLLRFHGLMDQARAAEDDDGRAELYEQALALWQGEAFADLDTPWLHTLRVTLAAHRHEATLDLTDTRLRQGRHTALLPELGAQITQHPLDERIAGQYLLALYRNGRAAQALEHYEHLRHLFAEEMGTDPSPALRQLHQRILTADPALSPPTPTTGPPPPAVPRQLPVPPRLFTGRSTELVRLEKALDEQPDTGNTMVIGGTGGIGKTSLALHWAHQHLDRFPDGQLHVNLRGFDPTEQPVSPATAVRGFLDALGVPQAAMPVDLDARIGLYRSLVAGKRMLIVLDNARDAAQVALLLPGTLTCTVLVTSRRHLGGLLTAHGAHSLDLDVFSEQEARQFLTRHLGPERVGAEPHTVTDLLSYCAGLPLALSIVAARAQRHPDFPLAALDAELRDQTRRLTALDAGDPEATVRTVLSWSADALSAGARAAFGLLGRAPGPDISLPAAASLLAQSTTATEATLRELDNASLLQQHVPGRYRMHDLVRLYAAERTDHDHPPAEQVTAVRRVVDFYLHTASQGDRHFSPHATPPDLADPVAGCRPLPLADYPAALAWFDADHAGVLAAQQEAATHGWHRVVWTLAWALRSFLTDRGLLEHELASWQAGLAAAEQLADATTLIVAHRYLGRALAHLGRDEEGLDHLQQALTLACEVDDRHQQAHTHQVLTAAWERQGDSREALDHAAQALRLYQELAIPVGEAEALNAMGWYTAQTGDHEQAREYCQAALGLHRHHHYRDGEASTLDSLGYIDHQAGYHERAIGHFENALALFRSLGNPHQEANTLDRLGHPYVALGQYDQARAVWRTALALYRTQRRDIDATLVQHQLDDLDGQLPADLERGSR